MKANESCVLHLTFTDEERKMVEEIAEAKGQSFEEAVSGMFRSFLARVVNHRETVN